MIYAKSVYSILTSYSDLVKILLVITIIVFFLFFIQQSRDYPVSLYLLKDY